MKVGEFLEQVLHEPPLLSVFLSCAFLVSRSASSAHQVNGSAVALKECLRGLEGLLRLRVRVAPRDLAHLELHNLLVYGRDVLIQVAHLCLDTLQVALENSPSP